MLLSINGSISTPFIHKKFSHIPFTNVNGSETDHLSRFFCNGAICQGKGCLNLEKVRSILAQNSYVSQNSNIGRIDRMNRSSW